MKRFFVNSSAIFLVSLFAFISSKGQNNNEVRDTVESKQKDLIFSRVETEATFPGGRKAWSKYITKEIKKSNLKKEDSGTCIVRFVVDKNGNVSDVAATTMIGSALAKAAIDAIQNGPRWNPARQNGRLVKAWRSQPVAFGPVTKKRA